MASLKSSMTGAELSCQFHAQSTILVLVTYMCPGNWKVRPHPVFVVEHSPH